MFSDKVWAMIHNRFKEVSKYYTIVPWTDDMSATDWWVANNMGNPYAENQDVVSEEAFPEDMVGFFERLHHAYNGTTNGFWDRNDGDEWEWYETWVLPFDNPIARLWEEDEGNDYTTQPTYHFDNMRDYFGNHAPPEMFNHENFNKVAETFSWRPPKPEPMFYGAINKKVVG